MGKSAALQIADDEDPAAKEAQAKAAALDTDEEDKKDERFQYAKRSKEVWEKSLKQ